MQSKYARELRQMFDVLVDAPLDVGLARVISNQPGQIDLYADEIRARRITVVVKPPGVAQAATGRYDVARTGTGELPRRLASVRRTRECQRADGRAEAASRRPARRS